MINPWSNLPNSPPYLLPEDRECVERFNARAKEEHQLRLDTLPEPYLGNPEAPVVLLNLNPGHSDEDALWHARQDFSASARANLLHKESSYPFYLLNPAYADSPGHQWWNKHLRSLIEEFGLERVARAVLCVELLPYHSRRFHPSCLGVPSQRYGRGLVRAAIERKAVIIIMRARERWLKAVPEIATAGFHELRNPQNPCISANNCPAGYRAIHACKLTPLNRENV